MTRFRAVAVVVMTCAACAGPGSAGSPGSHDDAGTHADAHAGTTPDAAHPTHPDGSVDDPCAAITCDAPPANTCINATTELAHPATGTCSAGTCSYSSAPRSCPNGCVDGACLASAIDGYIIAASDQSATVTLSSVSAALYAQPVASACTITAIGACFLTSCPDTPTTTPGSPVSAGELTVTGGSRTIVLDPSAAADYTPSVSTTSTLWSVGETLEVVAAGAQVPAFTMSLTAPGIAVISAPAPAAGDTIARSSDLVAQWTGGGASYVTIGISTTDGTGGSTGVSCSASASTGTLTIPAAVMSDLPATSASAELYAVTWTSTATTASGYTFEFEAEGYAVTAANAAYITQIKLD